MVPWSELPGELEDKLWDQFYARFRFRPSVKPEEWPGIAEPTPSVTYSISNPFREARDREHFVSMGMELNLAVLAALRACVVPDGIVYVLDWQHPCYVFRPHAEFDARSRSQWRVQPFPDGDYYSFLEPDFGLGTFGHPWEETLCLFGQRIIDAFDPGAVPWLGPVVRTNGAAA